MYSADACAGATFARAPTPPDPRLPSATFSSGLIPAPRPVLRVTCASALPWLYDLLMTRVLLAEDDTSISEPLSRALRREGYQVEITEDGPTTLGRALSDGIDLILLDIGDRKSTRLNSS